LDKEDGLTYALDNSGFLLEKSIARSKIDAVGTHPFGEIDN
jgi:hypothetical protein